MTRYDVGREIAAEQAANRRYLAATVIAGLGLAAVDVAFFQTQGFETVAASGLGAAFIAVLLGTDVDPRADRLLPPEQPRQN